MTQKNLAIGFLVGGSAIWYLNRKEKNLTMNQIIAGDTTTLKSIGKTAALIGAVILGYYYIEHKKNK
jgi:hypothetical protein